MVFKKYVQILSLPGALKFSVAGVIARFPMALVGISTILMIRAYYDNYTLAGLISGANVIAFAVGAPQLSRLVDTFGQARVMIPALLTSVAGLVGLMFATINLAPTWVLLVCAAIAGGFSGSMGALVRARWAYVVDKPGQLQAAYSLEAAFDEVVFVLGPVLATILATSVHPAGGLVLAIVLIICGGLWFLLQRATTPPPGGRAPGTPRTSVMRNPAMLVLAATFIGAGALFGANDLSVIAFTKEQGFPGLAGGLLAGFSFGSLLSALVYGARVWKWPLWKLYAVGIFCLAVGASTFAFASSIWVLAPIMLVTGMAIAPTMTNVNTIVQRIMPPARLTEGLTWMSTSMNIGVALSSTLTGRVIDATGSHGGFMMMIGAAWLMVLMMLLGLRVLRRETTSAPMIEA